MTSLVISGTFETIEMVFVSTLFAVIFGLPLGVVMLITRHHQLLQKPTVHRVLGVLVNILRSIPFIILLVAITPFTRLIVGTSIGTTAAMVPLAMSAIPFFARIVESALSEVSSGLIEAAMAMGATTFQIVRRVLLPEAMPAVV